MPSLPTGTVTFLFTDIEGSTRLLQQLGDRYAEVLATHHRLLRNAIDQAHGHVVERARRGAGLRSRVGAVQSTAKYTIKTIMLPIDINVNCST